MNNQSHMTRRQLTLIIKDGGICVGWVEIPKDEILQMSDSSVADQINKTNTQIYS